MGVKRPSAMTGHHLRCGFVDEAFPNSQRILLQLVVVDVGSAYTNFPKTSEFFL